MLFAPNGDCSTIEPTPFHATTDAGLKRCARRLWRAHWGGEELTLDGTAIEPAGYVGGTGVFQFRMPILNNVLGVNGLTGGRAAEYGAASILRPLSPGTHTLGLIDSFIRPTAVYKAVYTLTVE
jgi:hypothetical protein